MKRGVATFSITLARGRARGFSFVLLGWAVNARRRAMAIKPALPVQGDLFGGAA